MVSAISHTTYSSFIRPARLVEVWLLAHDEALNRDENLKESRFSCYPAWASPGTEEAQAYFLLVSADHAWASSLHLGRDSGYSDTCHHS